MRTCSQSVIANTASSLPIRGKSLFHVIIALCMLVHVIKRISNEFSFHTSCVFYIPEPLARGYNAHNKFHNTSYGMKIHLRSYTVMIR